MIVLHARPSPGFREAVDAIFGKGVVVHVDEAAPLDDVAGEITALLHVLTPVTAEFVASANGGNQTVPTLKFPDGSTLTNPTGAQVKAKLGR